MSHGMHYACGVKGFFIRGARPPLIIRAQTLGGLITSRGEIPSTRLHVVPGSLGWAAPQIMN